MLVFDFFPLQQPQCVDVHVFYRPSCIAVVRHFCRRRAWNDQAAMMFSGVHWIRV